MVCSAIRLPRALLGLHTRPRSRRQKLERPNGKIPTTGAGLVRPTNRASLHYDMLQRLRPTSSDLRRTTTHSTTRNHTKGKRRHATYRSRAPQLDIQHRPCLATPSHRTSSVTDVSHSHMQSRTNQGPSVGFRLRRPRTGPRHTLRPIRDDNYYNTSHSRHLSE